MYDGITVLRRQPELGRAIYIDMNSFFASVEQELHPELRGRPVGVCPFVNDRTCVIAASVEAKRRGVTTGTPIPEARRRCPDIALVSDNVGQYRRYHRRIMDSLADTRCQVHIKSIDEAFLVVPGDLRSQAAEVAQDIRSRIATIGSQLGCSIGIASNLFLAKMGTKLHKPRGLVTIRPEDLEAYYSTLQLTNLYGISWRLERRLNALGIESPLDFYHASYSTLKHAFGIPGERWYFRLRGYEVDERSTTRRMIGHQTTIVPEPAYGLSGVKSVTSQLCYRAAARLRAADLAAQSVQVALRFTDRTYWYGHIRTHVPFWDSATFFQHINTILKRWDTRKPVRLASVTAYDLIPQYSVTASMFGSVEPSVRVSRALDVLTEKFGRSAIVPAIQLLSEPAADRVGFGNAGHVVRELG